ncbi:MAG: hypothetical protein FVQ84_09150 [Planctomycetes bacterium]|nr:hypothetical protein [Planctomycetota bacterium]
MNTGIGYGADRSHNTRLLEVKPSPSLLRECPGCGREVLVARQRLCEDCKKESRRRTYREAYYKRRHNG